METSMQDSLTIMKLVHDLKSPLGALKILEACTNLEPEHKKILRLTRSFLESLICATKPRAAMPLSGARIEQIVQHIVEEKKIICPTQSIRLKVNGALENCEIHGDSFGLRRVLSNIIDNAIEAHQECGSLIPLEIEVTFSKRAARISCLDFGSGMANASRVRTLSSALPARPKGWGLGLTIVRDLCAQNGWELQLLSRGSGTCAILLL